MSPAPAHLVAGARHVLVVDSAVVHSLDPLASQDPVLAVIAVAGDRHNLGPGNTAPAVVVLALALAAAEVVSHMGPCCYAAAAVAVAVAAG